MARNAKPVQRAINRWCRKLWLPEITVDGEIGPETTKRGRQVAYLLGKRPKRHEGLDKALRRAIRNPDDRLSRKEKRRGRKRRRQRRRNTPLRERAYRIAASKVGVMEQGGNNVGPAVEEIIREGGGVRGQAWCGWFMAYCYKLAGSNAITWQMGAVRLWLGIFGVRRTSKPRRGDAVRFTFDHIGMFVRDCGDGTIETIEGNTGATGAVSDSATGGDGVYRKRRPKSLVRDYLRIYR